MFFLAKIKGIDLIGPPLSMTHTSHPSRIPEKGRVISLVINKSERYMG